MMAEFRQATQLTPRPRSKSQFVNTMEMMANVILTEESGRISSTSSRSSCKPRP